MPYIVAEARFTLLFNLGDETPNKDNDLMMAIITPRANPMSRFSSGKNTTINYEFYNPSVVSRQLAFGQLPIKLCYANVIKPWETITNRSDWDKVMHLPLDVDTIDIDLSTWVPTSLIIE
jgi:hypothetical protein